MSDIELAAKAEAENIWSLMRPYVLGVLRGEKIFRGKEMHVPLAGGNYRLILIEWPQQEKMDRIAEAVERDRWR